MKKFRTLIATIISLSLCFSTPKVVHAEQDLGPVTSKDVIYQIITDRFYDGDPSNNVQTNNEVFDDMDHDGYGDGNDLKLYQGGDFKGIIDKIPYLKEMGVTAVWISAPYENRDDPIIDYQPDGSVNIWSSFHGYHVRNYYTTNKHFGTMNDFENLKKELNDNGIKLVIDFVTNHTSRWQNPTNGFEPEDGKLYEPDKDQNGQYCFDENGEPYDFNGDGVVENLVADPNNDVNGFFHGIGDRAGDSSKFGFRHKDLGSLADFSQENGEVSKYLQDAMKFWSAKGVNGIRHDATLHMNPAFLKDLKDEVDSQDGPIAHFGEFFIGRPDPKYNEYKTFPDRTGVNNLDFEFFRSLTSTFGDFSKDMSDFANMLKYTSDDYCYENKTVTFMDNHDVSRFGCYQNRHEVYNAALVALLTSRGTPNIYYGTEQYVIPSDSSDVSGRVFMQTATDFDTNTDAYRIIRALSDLRQSNNALAYGKTNILFSNSDVLVMERQFYEDSVVVVINRQPDREVNVDKVLGTHLKAGSYNDELNGLCKGNGIEVQNNGDVYFGTIPGGYAAVYSYDDSTSTQPQIGDVVSTMGRAGNHVYIYGENLSGSNTQVKFADVNAEIVTISDTYIEAIVPSGVSGNVEVTVDKDGVVSNGYRYTVLSNNQVQVIFHTNTTTEMGETIHVVGNVPELGGWDTSNISESMMNPSYPEWFLPISVPENTEIEFKFVKKDVNGNVIYEQGENHKFVTPSSNEGATDTEVYDIWF